MSLMLIVRLESQRYYFKVGTGTHYTVQFNALDRSLDSLDVLPVTLISLLLYKLYLLAYVR